MNCCMPFTRDTIIAFMKAEPRPICPACVARALRLSFDRVMDAWADIRLRGDVPIQAGQCSVCRRQAAELLVPRR